MGYAARVKRKRACRHNCLLKVERTAAELKEHDATGHPMKEPEPFVVRPVFTSKYEPVGRDRTTSRQRRRARQSRRLREMAEQFRKALEGQVEKAEQTIATFGKPKLT